MDHTADGVTFRLQWHVGRGNNRADRDDQVFVAWDLIANQVHHLNDRARNGFCSCVPGMQCSAVVGNRMLTLGDYRCVAVCYGLVSCRSAC